MVYIWFTDDVHKEGDLLGRDILIILDIQGLEHLVDLAVLHGQPAVVGLQVLVDDVLLVAGRDLVAEDVFVYK